MFTSCLGLYFVSDHGGSNDPMQQKVRGSVFKKNMGQLHLVIRHNKWLVIQIGSLNVLNGQQVYTGSSKSNIDKT